MWCDQGPSALERNDEETEKHPLDQEMEKLLHLHVVLEAEQDLGAFLGQVEMMASRRFDNIFFIVKLLFVRPQLKY